MILGILSDTHGHAERAEVAVALLKRLGAAALVHCGDVGRDAVLESLTGVPAWFVWGNCDAGDAPSERYALSLGVHVPTKIPTRIELAGRVIDVYHGHEGAFERALQRASGLSDLPSDSPSPVAPIPALPHYILYGHTHTASDEQIGTTRFINPGALHRARTYTVATLDLDHDALEYWIVSDSTDPSRPRRFKVPPSG